MGFPLRTWRTFFTYSSTSPLGTPVSSRAATHINVLCIMALLALSLASLGANIICASRLTSSASITAWVCQSKTNFRITLLIMIRDTLETSEQPDFHQVHQFKCCNFCFTRFFLCKSLSVTILLFSRYIYITMYQLGIGGINKIKLIKLSPSPPLFSPRKDVWGTRGEFLYWWRRASDWLTQISLAALPIKKNYPDLGSDASSLWNFSARFLDVISRENQYWHRKMLAAFSRYWYARSDWLRGVFAWEYVNMVVTWDVLLFAR